jgi:hypothetical protein
MPVPMPLAGTQLSPKKFQWGGIWEGLVAENFEPFLGRNDIGAGDSQF